MKMCSEFMAESCHLNPALTCSDTSRMSHSSPHMSSTETTPDIVVSNVAKTPICGDEMHSYEVKLYFKFISRV